MRRLGRQLRTLFSGRRASPAALTWLAGIFPVLSWLPGVSSWVGDDLVPPEHLYLTPEQKAYAGGYMRGRATLSGNCSVTLECDTEHMKTKVTLPKKS